MLKVVTGIGAFILTFGFSVSLVGLLFGYASIATSASGSKQAISDFLRKDVGNGISRDRQYLRAISELRRLMVAEDGSLIRSYNRIVSEYVRTSSSMDDSVLPSDLQFAWREHMEAWQEHSDYLDAVCRGAESDGFKATYRENQREITETWYQVLRIAERYGADTRGMR